MAIGKLRYRLANKEDIPDITEMWKAMVNELHPDYSPREDWFEGMLENVFNSPMEMVVILAENGTADDPIGFIDGIKFPDPATGKIVGLCQYFYIYPEYRGQGIATGLLGELLRQAAKHGCEEIRITCGPAKLEEYMKRGFEPIQIILRGEQK